MSLETIRKKLDRYEGIYKDSVSKNDLPGVELLVSLAKHIIEKSSTPTTEEPKLKEPDPIVCKEVNPLTCPDYRDEDFMTLMQMRIKFGDIISPDHICRLFRQDDNFFRFCGMKQSNKYLIQPQRAFYYLWNISGPMIKNKLRAYSCVQGINSHYEKNNIIQENLITPTYPWWSVAYATDGYYA